MNKTTILNLLVLAGLTVMLVMALLPLLDINSEWMRWVYGGATIVVLGVRLAQAGEYTGNSVRLKRLHRILVASAVLYCTSAGLIFYRPGTTDWIAFLMAGAVVQTYASVMIDRELRSDR